MSLCGVRYSPTSRTRSAVARLVNTGGGAIRSGGAACGPTSGTFPMCRFGTCAPVTYQPPHRRSNASRWSVMPPLA